MMQKDIMILKGNICYSQDKNTIEMLEGAYVVVQEGRSQGVFQTLPSTLAQIPIIDYKDCLIIPGLIDLHTHAPQYAFRGMGMDLELLEWLNTQAFPEEAKYKEIDYAQKAYEIFVEDLKRGATTRVCIFATLHTEATKLLMDLIEQSGIKAKVGKVNMDRNSPEILCEESADKATEETIKWIEETKEKYVGVEPILTPRFIPSCSDELMRKLAQIQKKYQLPLQSHLSENKSEILWVKELCPDTSSYGDAYDQFGLFGGNCPTIMAHCVHSSQEECELMKKRGVFIAHCPNSNTNLSSGIAPIRAYLDQQMRVGLGTDVAGGFSSSIFRAMVDAMQVSKLRWALTDKALKPLTLEEAFYLGTKGGGAFFGKVGSFEKDYAFDAVVIDDSMLKHPQQLSLRQRLERVIYLSDERHIKAKYVEGVCLF